MTLPLFDALVPIAQRIVAAPHVLVALDYDGTLTPIVDDPSQATLDLHGRTVLQALAVLPRISVAIVSGRRLLDVQSLVGLDGLIYAGNHGFEIAGPDFRFIEASAGKRRRTLARLARILEKELAPFAGAIVENKDLTIAVHYRRVSASERQGVFRCVQAAAAVMPNSFYVSPGNHVLEIRPRVDWHKGRAVAWIAERLKIPNLLTLFGGDDQTDEDGFRFLNDAITVRVGDPSTTCAKYHVEGPEDVMRFLQWLTSLC